MYAATVDRDTADRILTGEQTILTVADEHDVAGQRVALVVDDAVVCTVTVDDALPIVGAADLPDPEQGFIADTTGFVPGTGVLGGPRIVTVRHEGSSIVHSVETGRAEREWPLGDFSPGRWGWLLSDPQPPTKPGRQDVFELPAEIAAQL